MKNGPGSGRLWFGMSCCSAFTACCGEAGEGEECGGRRGWNAGFYLEEQITCSHTECGSVLREIVRALEVALAVAVEAVVGVRGIG